MVNRRNLIINELKRRLLVANLVSSTSVYEGRGNVWGTWQNIPLPCIHIFEYGAQRDYIKPGLYVVTFPVQIEFVKKMTDKNLLYSEGRAMGELLRLAIELDERFTENFGTDTVGSDICIEYSEVADEVISPINDIVDSAVIYEFKFTEPMHGYELKRH